MPKDAYRVQIRRASRVHDVLPAVLTQAPAAGRRELPHEALGYQGGGKIETSQGNAQHGERTSKRPLLRAAFVTTPLTPESAAPAPGVPGERVYLRFTLPSRPLLAQWVHRLQQAVQGRAKV
jgi:hypothetical protein